MKFKRLSLSACLFCLCTHTRTRAQVGSLLDGYEIITHLPLMLIKRTHRAPDRRHATQISPGSCEEKQMNKTSVIQARDVISQMSLQ